jgi:hypothetical protein
MGSDTTGRATTGLDRAAWEKRWANEEVQLRGSDTDKRLWAACRYVTRPFAYFDKLFVVWRCEQGKPVIREVLTVTNVTVNLQLGVWVHLYGKVSKKDFILTHTPRKFSPDFSVMGWVPFFSEFRYTGEDWENPASVRNLRLNVCFRMLDRPDRLVEGQDYISELHDFRRDFSEYRDTKF